MLNSKIQFVYGSFVDSNFKYSVNEFGDVYSWNTFHKNIRNTGPKKMIPYFDKKGYAQYGLNNFNGAKRTVKAHVLVMEVFIGPRPQGNVIRHLNGDCKNNRLSNLAYGTARQNVTDSIKHGTHACLRKGEGNNRSILTDAQAIEVIEHLNTGMTCTDIAKIYNVSRKIIYDIKAGKTYSHLGRPTK